MPSDWQPSCTIELLKLRARLLGQIREFFISRNVLEVETPLLGHGIGTDPQLVFFTSQFNLPPDRQTLFLQTSPEFAMKRLLAAGSGSIFQICKAFRNGETGRYHNPEFTLLEWYRVGFDLPRLMDEVEALFAVLMAGLGLGATERISYRDAFFTQTGLDPLMFDLPRYATYAQAEGLPEAVDLCGHEPVLWLDFLFSHKVQPCLGQNALTMVYDYPACQSSLARLNSENPLVTERVELFINGVELGNGYHELVEPSEQEQRFDRELAVRRQRSLPAAGKDLRLLAALQAGLPDCSGIAIGLDRLLMLLSKSPAIADVLAFPIGKA